MEDYNTNRLIKASAASRRAERFYDRTDGAVRRGTLRVREYAIRRIDVRPLPVERVGSGRGEADIGEERGWR